MSAVTDRARLGGFEQRLLTQLRAHVCQHPGAEQRLAEQPEAPRTVPAAHRRSWRIPRFSLPAAATLTALATGVLTLLPAATPTLAQAFPILGGPTQALPARLARVLRAQWRAGIAPSFNLGHAYAFRTASGTGYVIVDRGSRWICILVPSFSTAAVAGRCEPVALARLDRPPLAVRISAGGDRQEIVALLPRGTVASATSAGHQVRVVLHHGVLAIVGVSAVTVTTTVAGEPGSRVSFMP